MDATTLVFIGAVAAVASAIGGYIGTYTQTQIADKQIHAQVVLAERMKWIGLVRDCIAEYAYLTIASSVAPDVSDAQKLRFEMTQSQAVLYYKVDLLLNPDEDDHIQLLTRMRDGLGLSLTAPRPPSEPSAVVTDISAIAKTILKREWERVKKGE